MSGRGYVGMGRGTNVMIMRESKFVARKLVMNVMSTICAVVMRIWRSHKGAMVRRFVVE
jgi:hypothetical protein